MTNSNSYFRRILSIVLVFCMLVSLPQIIRREVSAESEFSKVADPSTMDSWKNLFDPNDYNTENAGVVWTDKSVFTSNRELSRYGITMDNENAFLASLSLMASNKSVTGISTAPTDTMIVLDLSSSMYSSGPETVNTMVNAVNETMTQLQSMNINNRVGVGLFLGGENLWPDPQNDTYSMMLLPLGRYSNSTNKFLKTTLNESGGLASLDVNTAVYDKLGNLVSGSLVVKEVAGTYTQRGFLDAMDQFLEADTTVPMDSSYQPGANRIPVLLLMTDGEPTAASDLYHTQDITFKIGNNRIQERYPSQTDFLTLLTAAYVKERVDMHYEKTTPLFYTLSLGTSISEDVTNPKEYDAIAEQIRANPSAYTEEQRLKAERNRVVREHWTSMIKDHGFVFSNLKTYVEGGDYVMATLSGSSIEIPGKGLFPWSEEQRYYVDRAFTAAADASDLVEAFGSVVDEIAQQQKYFPTLVEGNQNSDGFVTFTDNIGKYMNVSDVKGIIFGNRLFSGADLASNFTSGGGSLGTAYNPTDLGIEMVSSVQKRLGISRYADAVSLITKAYNAGQLSYTNSTNYSNYIGWYADANGKYLGFWDGSTQNVPYGAVYAVKSYGYLGTVDDALGLEKSDMMYVDVQVRENIRTREQTVYFSVPASLVPVVNYDITLDRYGQISKFDKLGATSPMRLVYEVELDDAINASTVTNSAYVDSDYLKANSNPDGSVYFYTNEYEVNNTIGYGTSNTISYFRPSHQNDSYYFQDNAVIYVKKDDGYTEYLGSNRPNASGEYYYATTVYSGGESPKISTVYKKLSAESINAALYGDGGKWYVPKGSVNVMLDGYTVYKSSNPTNTLQDESGNGLSIVPFVDIEGHGVSDTVHHYVVGATLGNNGRITVYPTASIKISKTVEGNGNADDVFTFNVISANETNGTYTATKVDASGAGTATSVSFRNGKATVSLKAGEYIVISGLNNGNVYEITEESKEGYILKSVNGNTALTKATITSSAVQTAEARFVNGAIPKGSLAVTKTVSHTLGDGYQFAYDEPFEISISLSGLGSANATFSVRHSGDASITSLTTNAQGVFGTISLKDGETIEIFDIYEGVVATIVENNVPAGFVASYKESGATGDGVVTINGDRTAVDVLNVYSVSGDAEIEVNGTKILDGKDLKAGDFTFELKNESGAVIDSVKNDADGNFSFILNYTGADVGKEFNYTITEKNNGLGGIEYDKSVYNLKVTVSDDGNGGITVTKALTKNGAIVSNANFSNRYSVSGTEVITVKGTKTLTGKTLKDGDFTFVLKNESGSVISEKQNVNGEFEFTIAYSSMDVGTVYNYTISEVKGNLGGITYDTSVYNLKVTVSDNGVGGITVTKALTKNGAAVGSADFVNVYTVSGEGSVTVDGTKELVGKDLSADDFTFVLKNNEGEVIDRVKNDVNGKFSFTINYKGSDAGKVFNYTISEVNDGKGGITYDASVYNLKVTVTDNGEGGITVTKALTKNGVAVGSADFNNIYSVSGNERITVNGTKELTGKDLKAGDFTFELKNEAGTIIDSIKNDADGKFEFTLDYTGRDANKVFNYTITEKNDGKGGIEYDKSVYNLKVTVSDNGVGGITVTKELTKNSAIVESADFKNAYSVTGDEEITVNGTKTLTGKTLKDGDFSFVLKNEAGEVIATKQNANGKFEFVLNYKGSDAGKVFNYTISEVKGSLGGITYDTSVYNLKVTVSDNGVGGITVTKELTKNGATVNAADFVNVYTVKDTEEITVNGTKELTGKTLKDGDFTFVLKNEAGEVIESKHNVDGKFSFTLVYTEEHVGEVFNYTISEVKGSLGGITYDASIYNLKVTVTDNGVGGITVTKELTKNGAAVDSADFTNVYEVKDTEEIKVSGTKTLTGKTLKDGDFSFVLKNEAGEVIETKQNVSGKFEFALTYTEEHVGEVFNYTISEVKGSLGGITYDASIYNLKVTVTDNGVGGITVTKELTKNGAAVNAADFVNVYTIKDTEEITVNGTKELTGKTLKDGDFTFVLKNEAGEVIESKHNVDGKFSFTLVYTEEHVGEVFNYTISEVKGNMGGITYDASVYTLKVTVTDNGVGGITVTKELTQNGAAVNAADFVNVYTVKDTEEITVNGTKELTGKTLKDGDFTFVLKNEAGEVIESKHNVDGKFSFTLVYTEEHVGEVFNYTISEVKGSLGGITYDASVYNLKVTVTDNGVGGITVTKELTQNGAAVNAADFVNVYTVKDNEEITVNGTKELTGKTLKDGDFTFVLKNEAGEVIESKHNVDGKFSFTLVYTEEHVGEVFNYTISEVKGNLGGITYDASIYNLKVTVSDNGNGGITVVKEMTKNGVSATNALFKNYYSVTGVEQVIVEGTKELLGKELKDGDFTFVLKNEAGEVIGSKQNVNGAFEFVLNYTEADAGRVFTYTISEVNDGKGGIEYDNSIYTLKVIVADNGNGGITVTKELTKNDAAVTSAIFRNSYSVSGNEQIVILGTKELTGKELKDGDFNFVLKDKDGVVILTKQNVDGKFEFVLEYTEKDVGNVFEYTVTEINDGKGGIKYDESIYNVKVTVSDNGNGGITVVKEMTKDGVSVTSADFKNRYSVEGEEEIVIEGTKELIGKELKDGDFTFVLKNEAGDVITSKQNVNGAFEFVLTYTEEDVGNVFFYTISEVNDGKGGIEYDSSIYNLKVSVVDNGNGGITVAKELTKNDAAVTSVAFRNSYGVSGNEQIVIEGTKVLYGKDLVDGDFNFVLKDKDGVVILTKQNVNGKFEFVLEYTEKDIGNVFEYTVSEINDGKGGIKYDESIYNVKVTVSDNGNGGITVVKEMTKDGVSATNALFKNYYSVTGVEQVIVEGTKELLGKELKDGDFAFVLKNEAGEVIDSKQNVNGAFEFVLNYTEADAGRVFTYTISEVNDGKGGIEYDNSIYTLKVIVADNGNGGITVTKELTKNDAAVTSAIFRNSYSVSGNEQIVILGTKELTGKELKDGDFNFVLKDKDGVVILTKQNVDGKFEFVLEYTEKDVGNVFTYTISEVNDGEGGIEYDEGIYVLKVTVTDNGNGGITVTKELTKGGVAENVAEFRNHYSVAGEKEIVIEGTKELIGKELKDGDFNFILSTYEGEVIDSISNVNGKFEFVLTYTAEDVGREFNYKIYEANDGKGGIEYDSSIYNLKVSVVDDGKGGFNIIKSLTKNGADSAKADFKNSYSVSGEEQIVIIGTKELIGKDLADGDFTFALENLADQTIITKQNVDGMFEFVLEYTEADVGKVFEYKIYEVNDGKERVEYDDSIYNLKVSVSDNGEGGINVDYALTIGSVEVEMCEFVNSYTPKPDDIVVNIDINKIVENLGTETIGPDGFEFILENVVTGEMISVYSDVNGKAQFVLGYSENDIGKVFSYKVYEKNGGLADVTYSTAVYNVSVEISLGEDNKLYATMTNNSESVESLVCEFKNTYDFTPPAEPGDTSKTVLWTIVFVMSALGLFMLNRKKREENA